jgi:transcriptional regulator with PAS, ATPase and Fis domain
VITATGSNVLERVASEELRADLFYQLNSIHVVLRQQPAPPQPS